MTNDRLIADLSAGLIQKIMARYHLRDFTYDVVEGHEGGRNLVCVISIDEEKRYALRLSRLGDRSMEHYLAETEFIRYLVEKGASVADVILSDSKNTVESFEVNDETVYVSLFEYAKGEQIAKRAYRYREGVSIDEYFYNTGKVLGKIHAISKTYQHQHKRMDFFERYGKEHINKLIPDKFSKLKYSIMKLLERLSTMPQTRDNYGLVHLDYSDGNYNIDYSNGDITVFDFDNCCYCWYMYDIANLWFHGTGWIAWESNIEKRRKFMGDYMAMIIEGYRTETDITDAELSLLPDFLDMTLIESIVDSFECAALKGEEVDPDDIDDEARCLINGIPYRGFFGAEQL